MNDFNMVSQLSSGMVASSWRLSATTTVVDVFSSFYRKPSQSIYDVNSPRKDGLISGDYLLRRIAIQNKE